MRLVLRILGIFLVVVASAIVFMLVMGSRLPHEHTASASAEISAPRARVWQLIEDVNTQPTWRTGLLSIAATPTVNGHACWTEVQKHLRMPLCEELTAAPSTRIVRIADPTLPFGGTWTYQLQSIDANTTRLIITENGTTGPALYRFIGHYIYHEDTMVKQYEADVQKAVQH
jgi:hypothetical protein